LIPCPAFLNFIVRFGLPIQAQHASAGRGLAREHDIPLMQVLATFSYNPAKYLGSAGVTAMQDRGRLQEGMVADNHHLRC
jgi:alpha-D-ribose 1-methylphosphonate 5-triphosphate diphosphatase PhnM